MDLISFFGRLHPVVVHLPIGFLLLASAFDLLSYRTKFAHLRHAIAPALFAGFVSAIVACVFGYLLSLSGSYDDDILTSHKNAGILVAILSGLWWGLTSPLIKRTLGKNLVGLFGNPRITSAFGIGVVLVLTYAGHQGGSLTHGSDYLSFETSTSTPRPRPAAVSEAIVFDDIVLPLLDRRCAGCHRSGKRKGGLMVTSFADLMKGGENGDVIVPGDPVNSELYRRITLDPNHEDFMPTDGKTPLTKDETEVIRWWIEAAQASGELKVSSIGGHEEKIPLLAGILGLSEGGDSNNVSATSTRLTNTGIPTTVDMAAIENLREKGMMVRFMLHSPVMLDITLPAGSNIVIKEIEADLRTLAPNVVWLNLSNNGLATSDLVVLKEMTNLEKLRVERNPIGDDLVDIVKDLKHLESLNINDTKVTDGGYSKLKEHSSLKRIYRWTSGSATPR